MRPPSSAARAAAIAAFGAGAGRLSHLHVDDVAAGGLDSRRRSHHVHHHEGWNIAAPRGGQQGIGRKATGGKATSHQTRLRGSSMSHQASASAI